MGFDSLVRHHGLREELRIRKRYVTVAVHVGLLKLRRPWVHALSNLQAQPHVEDVDPPIAVYIAAEHVLKRNDVSPAALRLRPDQNMLSVNTNAPLNMLLTAFSPCVYLRNHTMSQSGAITEGGIVLPDMWRVQQA